MPLSSNCFTALAIRLLHFRAAMSRIVPVLQECSWLAASYLEVLLGNDVVPVEYRARLVTADSHSHLFGNPAANKIANRAASEVVKIQTVIHGATARLSLWSLILQSDSGKPLINKESTDPVRFFGQFSHCG